MVNDIHFLPIMSSLPFLFNVYVDLYFRLLMANYKIINEPNKKHYKNHVFQ